MGVICELADKGKGWEEDGYWIIIVQVSITKGSMIMYIVCGYGYTKKEEKRKEDYVLFMAD